MLTDALGELAVSAKVVHVTALCCIVLVVILLMSPPAFHRIWKTLKRFTAWDQV
jgi:hypothetical protein